MVVQMSTLLEIQDAVSKLAGEDKKALAIWLESQVEPDLTPAEEEKLLAALDRGIRSLDEGKGVPMDEARRRVASWASR